MDDGRDEDPTEQDFDEEGDWDFDDEDAEAFLVDHTAREMACTTMVMWGNLVAVLVDTLNFSGMPRELIHDILDRLDEASEGTLSPQGEGIAKGFVQAVRERVPGND